ncbi:hypothetical protein [Petrachloros mirabilis]
MNGGHGWVRAFLREVFTMPRQHVFVFFLATILLIILEVELTEGWHLVHLLELLGTVLILYMGWVTWRAARALTKREKL